MEEMVKKAINSNPKNAYLSASSSEFVCHFVPKWLSSLFLSKTLKPGVWH